MDQAIEDSSNSTLHGSVGYDPNADYDERSDVHNIILVSIGLLLALATFAIALATCLHDRRLKRSVVTAVDPERVTSDIPLGPIGQSFRMEIVTCLIWCVTC